MEPVINAFGALAHGAFHLAINGIWPGLALTTLVWVSWRFVRSASAATRYLVWWGALLICLLAPLLVAGVITWRVDHDEVPPSPVVDSQRPAVPSVGPSFTAIEGFTPAPTPVRDVTVDSFQWTNLIPPVILGFWAVLALILMIRLIRAFHAVQGIKRRSQPFDQSRFTDRLLHMLAAGTHRGAVAVRLSSDIVTPVAAGLGRPVILIPERIAGELSDQELTAVILHELSHLRRWDDLTKLLQKIIEALVFFHPAVFIIGRELELERELACDEWAVARTGARDDYARCLTRLVQLTHGCATTLIPGVLGGRRQVFKRFQRLLLGERSDTSRYPRLRLLGVMSIVVGLFLLTVYFFPAVAAPFSAVTYSDLVYAWADPSDDNRSVSESELARVLRIAELAEARLAREEALQNARAERVAAVAADNGATFAAAQADAKRALAAVHVSDASTPGRSHSRTRVYTVASSGVGIPTTYLASAGTYSLGNRNGNANSVRTEGDCTIAFATKGETIFTRELDEIKSITPEGYFELTEERKGPGSRRLRVESDENGELTYHYEVDGHKQDLDDAGRDWMADFLEDCVNLRNTGKSRSGDAVYGLSPDDGGTLIETGSGRDFWVLGDDIADNDGPLWLVDEYDRDNIPTSGVWRAETRRSRGRIEIRLRGERGRSQHDFTVRDSELNGWKDDWRVDRDDAARFEYVADAGTLSFQGEFRNGRGEGKYEFTPSDEFRDVLIKAGCRRSELTDGKMMTLFIYAVDQEFVNNIKDAGYRDLSVDELIELRIHGATGEYLEKLNDVGYGDIGRRRLVEFLIHGVDPDQISEFQTAGYKHLSPSDIIAFRIHDVTPKYVADCVQAGYENLSPERLIEFKIHDVDPRDVKDYRDAGLDHLSTDDLLAFHIHDVSPRFVRACAQAGCAHMAADDLLSFSIHGVDPDDIREFVELGYNDLDPDDYITFAIHGIKPQYVRDLAGVGYRDLSPDMLVGFAIHGVTAGYVKRLESRGMEHLSPEDLLDLRITGWGQ